MWTALIVGDFQAPYQDQSAVNVFCEIAAFLPAADVLDLNGDILDCRVIGRYPYLNKDERLASELRHEIKTGRGMAKELIKAARPKRINLKAGNHEWRALRAMEKTPQTLQLLAMPEIFEALDTPALLGLHDDKRVKYAGPYPRGMWLHSGLDPHRNVWVEHGYSTRVKSGYTVTNLMEKRWASCVVNHCERLAGPIYSRKLGNDYFGIENGNFSIIGEPGRGDGIYQGVPHSEPAFLEHRQGFSILHWDGSQWHAQVIKIRDGRAVYGGKLFKG